MSQRRILVFIPTYNESGNVERMARELSSLPVDLDILFLDDNSPDGTGPLLDRLASENSRMSVIHRKGKEGIGSAHQVGISRAYEGGYDVLVTLDCDFTHDPKDIPRLLEAMHGYDMAVGSRWMERGSLPDWNLMRRCLTLFGHLLTTTLLGLPQDASGAFRAYDLRRVDRKLFSLVPSRSYPFFFESLFVLVRNGLSINEIPIVLPSRTYGSSKLTAREAVRGGCYLFGLWLGSMAHPERFLQGRKPDIVTNPDAVTDWDAYWSTKISPARMVYDILASFYRKLFIGPNLRRVLKQRFREGTRLLHAGCGSGQTDAGLHGRYAVTAVDLSPAAIELYSRNNPKAERIEQADIFRLPHDSGTFDGVYNLGVMEHYDEEDIQMLLAEFGKVLKPGGKVVLFWTHASAPSVFVLRAVHFVMQKLLGNNDKLHPDEITLVTGKAHAQALLERAGFTLEGYEFGIRDLFIQAVVTAKKP